MDHLQGGKANQVHKKSQDSIGMGDCMENSNDPCTITTGTNVSTVHSAAEPACNSQTPQEERQEAGQWEDTSPDSLVSLALPGYLVVTILYSICTLGVNFRCRHAHTQARIHTHKTHMTLLILIISHAG